jgi:hypothetical protein
VWSDETLEETARSLGCWGAALGEGDGENSATRGRHTDIRGALLLYRHRLQSGGGGGGYTRRHEGGRRGHERKLPQQGGGFPRGLLPCGLRNHPGAHLLEDLFKTKRLSEK